MRNNKTFTMLKPDALENSNMTAILEKIIASGFRIIALKLTRLTVTDAESFYAIHNGRPFFRDLVSYMTRGPIIAAVLQKDNAVQDFRTLIGKTDPSEAEKGTIRNMFASSVSENAIHGSDSDENAMIECNFHFLDEEVF